MDGELTKTSDALIKTVYVENFGQVDVYGIRYGDEDTIDYYDIFLSETGECLNEGEPFYDVEPDAKDIENFLFPIDNRQ